jgi:hypothetical protein
MLYISRKKEHGVRGAEKSGKSCHSFESKTHEVVAKETGVSPATIMRDAAYAEAGRKNMEVTGKAKNQCIKMIH